MRRNGLRATTIKNTLEALKFLAKHVDLSDPELVKGFIARLDGSEGYKRNLAIAYGNYCKYNDIQWIKPKYRPCSKLPKTPSEEKVSMLIANSPEKLALAISMSRDTGLRPVELMNLRLKDIDVQHGLIYPQTAKHGKGRVLKLKGTTLKPVSLIFS